MSEKSKWIFWKDLIDQGFTEHELLDSIVKGDRKPFSRFTGKHLVCPSEYNQTYLDWKGSTWIVRKGELVPRALEWSPPTDDLFLWKNFKFPHDKDKVKQLFEYLANNVIFKLKAGDRPVQPKKPGTQRRLSPNP